MTNKKPAQPVDAWERAQAVDPTRSFICSAPAGSGKTQLLTQRFLNLLLQCEQPENILAITFTRKAVAEMQERISGALHTALQQPEPKEPHLKTLWQLASRVLEKDKERGWKLLENINRLQIKTFDSLCAQITHAAPFFSAFGSTPNVSDQPEELYREAVQEFLSTLDAQAHWSPALEILFARLDVQNSLVENLLIKMLHSREQWLPHVLAHAEDSELILDILEQNLLSARKDIIENATQLVPLSHRIALVEYADYAAQHLAKAMLPSPVISCLGIEKTPQILPDDSDQGAKQWLGIITLLLTANGGWRKTVNRKTGFPVGERPEEKRECREAKEGFLQLISELKEIDGLQGALVDIRYLPQSHFKDYEKELLSAIAQLLPVLTAYLQLTFKKYNCVDFTEISASARSALGKMDFPSDLALSYDCKIQHMLVDEFQDTSNTQMQLLQLLTAGWSEGDGRTLFCVGDAMQSIYSFRGANVGLFIHAFKQGLPNVKLEPLQLKTNFRSQSGIVDWNNKVFERAFPKQDEVSNGAVRYSPSVAFLEKLDGRPVWLHGFGEGLGPADEARTMLGIIRKTRMDAPDDTIAVLVRSRNHASELIKQLVEAKVKYRALDLEALKDNVLVRDLMSLTLALLYPWDRVAWLSFLRSPWCGLSLIDLEAISRQQKTVEHSLQNPPENSQGNTQENAHINSAGYTEINAEDLTNKDITNKDLANETQDEQPPLLVIEQIQHILNTSSATPCNGQREQDDLFAPTSNASQRSLTPDGRSRLKRLLPIIECALKESHRRSLRQWVEGVWIKLGGPACLKESNDLDNAQLFFEALDSVDVNGHLESRKDLKQAIEKLFSAPDPQADGKLYIMTIHKAKGLEFDTVIVPGLQKLPRASSPGLLRWDERVNHLGETELLMVPITEKGKEKDPNNQYLSYLEKKKAHFEKTRLLYVACTRAKKRLHLLAEVQHNSQDSLQLKSPAKGSLLNSVWSAIHTDIKVKTSDKDPEKPTSKTKYLMRVPRDWQLPELNYGHQLQAYIPSFEGTDEQNIPELKLESDPARHVGTLIHELLQQMAQEGIEHWSLERIENSQVNWRCRLAQMGVNKNCLNTALESCRNTAIGLLEDPQLHAWLNSQKQKYSEYAISSQSRSGVRHHIIDLLLIEEQQTWIIDYKITQPSAGQSLEAFLQEQQEHYRQQMNLYAKIVGDLGYKRIRCGLYLPLIKRWIEY